MYFCHKPIKKENNKVKCNGKDPSFKVVGKDQLETVISYKMPASEDTVYVRAVTRNQAGVESDLSNEVMTKPSPIMSLANSRYLMRASEHFLSDHPVEHLWDGCLKSTPKCTGGTDQADILWIEFDFKRPLRLYDARLFGDTIGRWLSRSWSLSYKMEADDSWQQAFTRVRAQVDDWVHRELENIVARYVRVEIFGDPDAKTVQARELEIRSKGVGGR